MQEHLHIGRPSWKRLGIAVLILASGVAFPFVVGLHIRCESFDATGDANHYTGNIVKYTGCGPDEYYGVPTNQIAPLFIVVPLPFLHSNTDGMKWLQHFN